MPATVEGIAAVLKKAGLRALLDPERPNVLFYQVVMPSGNPVSVFVMVEAQGAALQMRSFRYLTVPEGHPRLDALLRHLMGVNYQFRYIKFGWDQSDGEVTAYADMVIADGEPTEAQVCGLMTYFVHQLDEHSAPLRRMLEQQAPATI